MTAIKMFRGLYALLCTRFQLLSLEDKSTTGGVPNVFEDRYDEDGNLVFWNEAFKRTLPLAWLSEDESVCPKLKKTKGPPV